MTIARDLIIEAQIVRGLGAASRTIARQIPLISETFPEVANCYPGTINLQFDKVLTILEPDHRTPPLAWTPSGYNPEVFDFVRIEVELPHSRRPVPAWLYVAHRSPHRKKPTIHEIIAERLDLADARTCCIRVSSISVKYR